ncbi:RimK domain-containing protein ATP-grasp [Salinarchaeum sp. Harcht-Bsk1]|uniref:ATP-grasp domain-containing protein n=1 Tax=Salinarchaeum sp. Harcht-Bsk1 TaxID=1333523 RepID=UPI0003423569|nr:ATP-grasp domain-containing protein [Salinarchaeum sp. Harcht-Bsk1]AGN00377.1 RimK domain-containing protein ATP-grasp [Salinarchaeum sp. Harcht-Bsk1]
MLRLAVATDAETFERLEEPLAARGIEVVHLQTKERTIGLTEPDARENAFAAADHDVGYVFPPRDVEGAVADAMLEIPWLVDHADVQTSRNKAEVLARCAAAGLPVPVTVLVSNPIDENRIREAVEQVGPPVVIKPTSTTRGVGVAKVGDADSALGVADYLDLVHDFAATGDKSFLVQSFVPDARDVRAMTIEGEYVGAVERERAGGWRHNVHRGAEATGIDLDPELRSLAEAVAQLLGIDLLGVDLLVTEDDAFVSETNARPTIDDASKYEPDFYDRLSSAIERTADEQ